MRQAVFPQLTRLFKQSHTRIRRTLTLTTLIMQPDLVSGPSLHNLTHNLRLQLLDELLQRLQYTEGKIRTPSCRRPEFHQHQHLIIILLSHK
jgi:hypothetical protein